LAAKLTTTKLGKIFLVKFCFSLPLFMFEILAIIWFQRAEPSMTRESNLLRPRNLLLFLACTSALGLNFAGEAFALPPSQEAGAGQIQAAELEDISPSAQKAKTEVATFLSNYETLWNSHNLDGVMANYAEEYINNDGLDKKAVAKLTQDFWKTYPDARSASTIKQIRCEGNFATVESKDIANGSTAKEMPGLNSKGELTSVSEGQLYLKKFNDQWRIIGDRIDYEKVRVAFGLAKNLITSFTAPEQMKANKQYSARLEVSLPPGLYANGSISAQPLKFPQATPQDALRPLEQPGSLERVMNANAESRNELLTATVILTDSSRQFLKGVSFLTRRLNVVPEALTPDMTEEAVAQADKTGKADKAAEKAEKADKASEKAEKTDKPSEKAADKASEKTSEKAEKADKVNKSDTPSENASEKTDKTDKAADKADKTDSTKKNTENKKEQ
jgi:hypothetical protein